MGRRGDVEQRTDETLIKSQVNISGGAGPQVCRREAPLPAMVNQEVPTCAFERETARELRVSSDTGAV